jgi:hypothetical protein
VQPFDVHHHPFAPEFLKADVDRRAVDTGGIIVRHGRKDGGSGHNEQVSTRQYALQSSTKLKLTLPLLRYVSLPLHLTCPFGTGRGNQNQRESTRTGRRGVRRLSTKDQAREKG